MSSQTATGPDHKTMAAVMAAVDAFLFEEALKAKGRAPARSRAWKMAARQAADIWLSRSRSWTGRDGAPRS